MKVAYQGVPGAYSEMAARALFTGCGVLPKARFADVFAAVEGGEADAGVLPVENSLGGSIHENYDLLVRHDLRIFAETYVHVNHALLARPGTRLGDIRKVRSHYQALAQCAGFFAGHPDIAPVIWYDTAGAAKSVAALKSEQGGSVAAIASELAAELYGLKILKRKLQDRPNNFTRFLAVRRADAVIDAKDPKRKAGQVMKTSLTFIPKRNKAGVLHAVTGVFAARGIDLTKIESRPDPDNPFDYRFYLDAAGDAKIAPLKEALAALKPLVRDLRVLGSYPAAKLPR